MSQTNERRTMAAASPAQHRFSVVLQIVILAWLVIITCRYLQEAGEVWSKRVDYQFRDVDAFRVLLIAWLVVISATFVTGLSSKPLVRRLGAKAVLALAVLAILLVTILSQTLVEVLAFLWLILVAFGIGNRLLHIIFRRQPADGVETTVFSLGLGVGTYYLFALTLALSGFLHRWVAIAALSLLSLLLRRDLLKAVRGSVRRLRNFHDQVTSGSHDFLSIPLLSILAFLAVVYFVGAIGPEIRSDSLVYHLPVLKTYIRNHRLVELPYNFRSYWPKGTEMVFSLGLLLGGQVTAKLFSFGFGLLTATAIFAFSGNIVSPKASLLAAALFYSAPLVGILATTTYVELGWTLFAFLSIYAISRWLASQDTGWVTIAGLMSGCALSSKTSAMFLTIPLAIGIFVVSVWGHRSGLKTVAERVIRFVLLTSFVGAPWYILSWIYTGNPVFPFLNAIFRSPQWAPVNETFNFSIFGTGRDLLSMARLPWDMTFQSSVFVEGPDGAIGASLLIAVALPLVATRAVARDIILLGFLALFCTAEWVLSVEYLRYYVPYLPVISILAAYVIDRAYGGRWRPPEAKRRSLTSAAVDVVVLVGFVATLPILLVGFWFYEEIPYKVALGLESRGDYLSRTIPTYDADQYLNTTYRAEQIRILAVGGYEALYTDAEIHPSDQPCCLSVYDANVEEQLLAWLRQRRFTHLLVNYVIAHGSSWMENAYLMSRQFLERCAQLEYTAHNVAVYRLLSDTEIERRALYLPAVDELLQNPGFEDGEDGVPSSWDTHGRTKLDQSGERSHGGQGAVLVKSKGYLSQVVPVWAKEIYILRVYNRAGPGGEKATLEVTWHDVDGYPLRTDWWVVAAAPQWQEHHMPFKAPAEAVTATILVSPHVSGSVWFDDLSFKRELGSLPTPDSLSSCVELNTPEADGQLGRGWYEVEEAGAQRWRWMAQEGWLLLGVERGKDTLQVEGYAATERFQTGAATLQVFANEQLVGEDWLPNGDFVLGPEVPRELLQDEFVIIRLRVSDAFVPEGELRELGIIVDSVCFR